MFGDDITDKEIVRFLNLRTKGSERRRHIRIMGVGQEEVGKTTLCWRLLKKDLKDKPPKTKSIDTLPYCALMASKLDAQGEVALNFIGKYTCVYH